jgi:Bacterial SH3 domain.
VYCSQSATVKEASDALIAAGVASEKILEADGGASATCGYNLPGQFFVEPTRTLPLLMGAKNIIMRGKITSTTANVRSGPGTKYPIVAKLAKNDAITALGELSGWYRIGDGRWVIKTLIK